MLANRKWLQFVLYLHVFVDTFYSYMKNNKLPKLSFFKASYNPE